MTRKRARKTTPKAAPRLEPGNRPVEHVVVRDDDKRLHEVDRIVVTVEAMHRAGQIDRRQFQAAEAYKDAWDAMHSGMPCALDRSRMGGGGGDGSPSDWKLWGYGQIREAGAMLGAVDAGMLNDIIGEGHTIKSYASRMGDTPTEANLKYLGKRFRDALTQLADKWVPDAGGHRIRGTGRADQFDPAMTGQDEGARGKVAISGRVS